MMALSQVAPSMPSSDDVNNEEEQEVPFGANELTSEEMANLVLLFTLFTLIIITFNI